jgi:hypothetical protein
VNHAIIAMEWDYSSRESLLLRGILNMGNTVRISMLDHPDTYLELTNYHEKVDTKHHAKSHGTRTVYAPEYGTKFEQYGENMLRYLGICG